MGVRGTKSYGNPDLRGYLLLPANLPRLVDQWFPLSNLLLSMAYFIAS